MRLPSRRELSVSPSAVPFPHAIRSTLFTTPLHDPRIEKRRSSARSAIDLQGAACRHHRRPEVPRSGHVEARPGRRSAAILAGSTLLRLA